MQLYERFFDFHSSSSKLEKFARTAINFDASPGRAKKLFSVLLTCNSPKIALLFPFFFSFCWCFSTRRHDHLSLERGKAETLRRNITRGCLSGTLSHGTYQATFRTRSIFVMRVDSRARPSDVGRESTTFKAEQRIGYIIQNVGTNQQASLDPRTRFNGRCFIVEPVGCLHLNDWFHWGEKRGGITPIPRIIDAFSFRFSHFFNTEKLSENSAFISHWNTQGRLFIHWRQTIFRSLSGPVSASFFSSRNKCQHLSTKSLSSIDS